MAIKSEQDASKALDTLRVDVSHDRSRRYWSARFGVTEEELARAVSRVGDRPQDVERFLSEGPGDTSPSGASHWRATSGL